MKRDGTVITLKKAEDFEYLARLVVGGIDMAHDDAKVLHISNMLKKMFAYNVYNVNKYVNYFTQTISLCSNFI